MVGQQTMLRGAKIRLAVAGILLSVVTGSHALADQQFTPPDIWSDEREARLFEDWIGGELRAMGEPSLWQMSKSDKSARIYRMLELPALSAGGGARVVIRADGSATIHVTRLELADDAGARKPKEKRVVSLTSVQTRALEAHFARSGFWGNRIGMTERADGKPVHVCLDGVQYVVEALKAGSYKFVTRHICSIEDDVFEILKTLAALSGLREPQRVEF